jgi:hypothetical protein
MRRLLLLRVGLSLGINREARHQAGAGSTRCLSRPRPWSARPISAGLVSGLRSQDQDGPFTGPVPRVSRGVL